MPAAHAVVYGVKAAVELWHASILLAFGDDGCCHLISMTRRGRLAVLQSIASILSEDVNYYGDMNKLIFSVTETDRKGQFILTGYKWLHRLCLQFK